MHERRGASEREYEKKQVTSVVRRAREWAAFAAGDATQRTCVVPHIVPHVVPAVVPAHTHGRPDTTRGVCSRAPSASVGTQPATAYRAQCDEDDDSATACARTVTAAAALFSPDVDDVTVTAQ